MAPITRQRERPLDANIPEVKSFLRFTLIEYATFDRITISKYDHHNLTRIKIRSTFFSCEDVKAAFGRLPWHQRVCIYQNLADGMTQESIAEYHEIGLRTVQRYIHDGMITLIEILLES